jgi:hypothetical protein
LSSFLGGIVGNVSGALGVGSIGRATVGLVLDDRGYNANLQKAKVETEASTGSMAKNYAALGPAIAIGATALAAFAVSSVKAAIEQKEAQDKLANSIANSSTVTFDSIDAFDQQATSIAHLTGVQDDAITTAQAMAVQFGLTADQVTTLTPLVVDLAQKNGVDLTTAMSAVGKAVNGNSGALARLKLNVDKVAFAEDHFAATQKALESGVKGYAEQLANEEPWRIVENNVHELQESIGNGLLPVLRDTTSVLADLSSGHLPNTASALRVVSLAFGATTGNVDLLKNGFEEISGSSGDLQAQLTAVDKALQDGTITAGDAVAQVRQLAAAHHLDEASTNALSTAIQEEAQHLAQATNETQKNTAALRANRTQVLSDAGGLLGLSASLAQVEADERAVNEARRRGTLDTKAGQAAQRDYLQDKLAFIQALRQERQDMIQNRDSTEQIITTLTRLGKAAGISRQEIEKLTAGINGLPSNKQVNINIHSYRTGYAVGPV